MSKRTDRLTLSNSSEWEYVRLYGDNILYGRTGTPRVGIEEVDVYRRDGRPVKERWFVAYDKDGDEAFRCRLCLAESLGVKFLKKQAPLEVRFTSEIVPIRFETRDNHGLEYEVATEFGIKLPSGLIANPEGMRCTVNLVEDLGEIYDEAQ